MLYSDRPVVCAAEDQLRLQPFAAVLARGLREMAPSEGMVVALHAPWGSGKTSALNLFQRHTAVLDVAAITGRTVEDLAALAAARSDSGEAGEETRAQEWEQLFLNNRAQCATTVVRFNPWYFSGQESLFKAFFGVLGTELELAQNSLVARAVGKLLKRGAEAGTAAGAVTGALVGGPPGAAGGAAVGGFFGRFLNDRFDDKESLEASLRELRDALLAGQKRVLVILDDMDRLLPDELRQMLSLVKSLGHLPKVVYLAAYDRAEIARLLKSAGIDSEDYLEKIVQVSFELPKADRHALRSLLFSRLDTIRQGEEIENPRRWGISYFSHVDPYLTTPRDVIRLTNSLQVVWPSVKGEVDWSDLVVLETLRLHESNIYSKLVDKLDLLTGAESSWREEKVWAEALRPTSGECANPEVAKEALEHLFPRLAQAWKSYGGTRSDETRNNRDRRLSSADYARNYFVLSPSPDQFSAVEVRSLLASEDPERSFEALLKRAKERKTAKGLTMVARLLDQLNEEISSASPITTRLARALISHSDEILTLRDAERTLFEVNNRQRLAWLFVHALRVLPEERRGDELLSWMSDEQGISFLAPFSETLTSAEAGTSGDTILPSDSHARVRTALLDMVGKAIDYHPVRHQPIEPRL